MCPCTACLQMVGASAAAATVEVGPLLAEAARRCVSEQWHFISLRKNSVLDGLVASALLDGASESGQGRSAPHGNLSCFSITNFCSIVNRGTSAHLAESW